MCGDKPKKQKWVLLGIYHPPNLSEKYFYDHISRVLDYYSYNLHNLVKEKTCFKGPPKCYDLILKLQVQFQNTLVLTSGFFDFHKMTITVLKTEFY